MRSPTDWAALKKAEDDGREPPGTYARLWQEEMGDEKGMMSNNSAGQSPPPAASVDAFAAVADLLAVLSDPKGAAKTLASLRDAVTEHKAASDKLAADKTAFDEHLKKERAEFEQMAHSRTLAMSDAATAHAEAKQAFHQEMEIERRTIAEMRAAAEKDKAMAADLLERAQRRIKAFDSAA